MAHKSVPRVVVKRLPIYLRELYYAAEEGYTYISSHELGQRLGYTAAQIRKDLSTLGEFGKQGAGYPVAGLIKELEAILHVDRIWEVALVGVGDLGHALIHYQGFHPRGFRIVLAFDNDPAKIGQRVGDLIIHDVQNLENEIRQAGIQIGMITTPASAAQEVAQRLVKAGVRGILNYAPVHLNLPSDIEVEYIDPVIHLQRMTFFLGGE